VQASAEPQTAPVVASTAPVVASKPPSLDAALAARASGRNDEAADVLAESVAIRRQVGDEAGDTA